jgi:ABC-2 type transport system permease protein
MELLRIIRSENLKIYQRKSTLVMIGLLTLLDCYSAISSRINPLLNQGLWGAVGGETWLFFLITIFTMIIAAGIVANEFNWGTIKLLLIHPISRAKILLGKYLALLLFGVALTLLLLGFSLVIHTVWYGLKFIGLTDVSGALPSASTPNAFNSFGGVLWLYGLKYVDVMVYGTFAFMLSALSKSNALTIGVSLLAMIFGPELTNYLFSNSSVGKYVFFTHLDLAKYFGPNAGQFSGMSFQFSALVLFFYVMIFNIIAWLVFTKRDILN